MYCLDSARLPIPHGIVVKNFLEFGTKEKREPRLQRLARDSDAKFAATTNCGGSASRELSGSVTGNPGNHLNW
jgi:hypothetical protein